MKQRGFSSMDMCQLNEEPEDYIENPSSGCLTDIHGGKNEVRRAFKAVKTSRCSA